MNRAKDIIERAESLPRPAKKASPSVPSALLDPPLCNSPLRTPLALLSIHPAHADMPQWADDDERFQAFVRDIAARGIDYPLLIDSKNRIGDGRQRFRAAKILKLETVPTQLVPDDQVDRIIVQTLVQRRHYPKGAIAYMVARFINAQGRTQSLDLIASESGLGLSTLKQAFQLLEIFSSGPEGEAYRAEVEADILSGDSGLGGILAGWAGRQATKGQTRHTAAALDLWSRALTSVTKRFQSWEKFDDQTKAAATAKLGQFVETFPDDLLQLLLKRAAQEKKRRETESESK